MEMIIAANWKMHKTAAEAVAFCERIKAAEDRLVGVEVLLCAPFTALAAVGKALEGSAVKLGAQNMFWEEKGAFTGEIAPLMLLEFGTEYVILGHSERRHIMGEDDAMVRRKLETALRNNLKPILCVGETEAERERDETGAVLARQITAALQGFDPAAATGLVVAYEPVWAISTGKAASPRTRQRQPASDQICRRPVCGLHGWRPCGCIRGQRQTPEISDPSWRCRRSTAPWWAAPPRSDSFINLITQPGRQSLEQGRANHSRQLGLQHRLRRQCHIKGPPRIWTAFTGTTRGPCSMPPAGGGSCPGQMGNSEVGHLNIGAGRIVYQELSRIKQAIKTGVCFDNPALREAMGRAVRQGGSLHLIGLVSDGGVHSHLDHLTSLVEMARREQVERVYIHAILVGRDTPPACARPYLERLITLGDRLGRGRSAHALQVAITPWTGIAAGIVLKGLPGLCFR